ncbi:MAG TPA: Hsp20/alpha crystallin family protein [Solirubrobacteraceae bacterium]|jgi:HSP20 family protein|nr:Hsp20/alpha crystallin family protein [Solirubrobacteraceae bacterium]
MALPVRRRDTAPQPIQRWDPFRELEGLQEQLAQLMQRSSDGDGGAPFIPLVDIEETEDAWIVEADLPGVKPEDVEVEVRGSEIAIAGEIKEREREGILRRRTRKTGEFDYHITMPGDADAENIEAELRDGVLAVRIPKPEQERPRRIDVRSA